MIVEPYNFQIPLSIDCLKTGAMRGSNRESNAEQSRDGGRSALFSIETGTRGAGSRIEGFLSQLFQATDFDDNVEAATEFAFPPVSGRSVPVRALGFGLWRSAGSSCIR